MDLFDDAQDMNKLLKAFYLYYRNTSWKAGVQSWEMFHLCHLNNLRKSLKNGTYKHDPCNEFFIIERGVKRCIDALTTKDSVLHRELAEFQIGDLVSKSLIYDNGANLKDKGVAFTRKRVKKFLVRFMNKHGLNGYVLTTDFSGYYASIRHDILMDDLRKIISDERLLKLLEAGLKQYGEEVRIGLGSPLSTFYALLYGDKTDRFCTCVKGCPNYIRHADDIWMAHESREFLENLLQELSIEAAKKGLKLNLKKTKIRSLSRGFTFLKVRYVITKDTHKILELPNKKIFIKEKRKLKHGIQNRGSQYYSWRRSLKRFDCHKKLIKLDSFYKEIKENEQS